MHNYKITICYDGAQYKGWQRTAEEASMSAPQPSKSIQGTLEAALSQYLGIAATITGSGRTDAGVSAVAQTANFYTDSELNLTNFLPDINQLLPDDIRIKAIEAVPLSFHSRKNALSKTYGYYISLDSKPDVFSYRHTYNPSLPPIMYSCAVLPDMDAMRCAADALMGTHDFSAFTTDKTPGKSHIRTINNIDFSYIDTPSGKPVLAITVNGNGFLYNMVRIIAGTLLCVGLKKIPAQDIPAILRNGIRKNAGPTLPSNGLFLLEVFY